MKTKRKPTEPPYHEKTKTIISRRTFLRNLAGTAAAGFLPHATSFAKDSDLTDKEEAILRGIFREGNCKIPFQKAAEFYKLLKDGEYMKAADMRGKDEAEYNRLALDILRELLKNAPTEKENKWLTHVPNMLSVFNLRPEGVSVLQPVFMQTISELIDLGRLGDATKLVIYFNLSKSEKAGFRSQVVKYVEKQVGIAAQKLAQNKKNEAQGKIIDTVDKMIFFRIRLDELSPTTQKVVREMLDSWEGDSKTKEAVKEAFGTNWR